MSSRVRNVTMLALLTLALPGLAKVSHSNQTGTSIMTGQWSIEGRRDDRVLLQLQLNDASFSTQLALNAFQGLTKEQIVSGGRAGFQLVREAGTFNFSGSFRERAGEGQWTLDAASAFLTLLNQYGYKQPTNEELFALAVSDVNAAYIAGLRSTGYDAISLKELAALRSNGVTTDDVQAFHELLAGDIPVKHLIALKSNNVTVSYINSLAEAGYKKLTAPQLVALRSNGVDREFIERLERRGQKNLTVGRLVSLRTNGF